MQFLPLFNNFHSGFLSFALYLCLSIISTFALLQYVELISLKSLFNNSSITNRCLSYVLISTILNANNLNSADAPLSNTQTKYLPFSFSLSCSLIDHICICYISGLSRTFTRLLLRTRHKTEQRTRCGVDSEFHSMCLIWVSIEIFMNYVVSLSLVIMYVRWIFIELYCVFYSCEYLCELNMH